MGSGDAARPGAWDEDQSGLRGARRPRRLLQGLAVINLYNRRCSLEPITEIFRSGPLVNAPLNRLATDTRPQG
jgi:hypothetical protein